MIYTVVAALSFFAPPTSVPQTAARGSALTMSEPVLARRAMLTNFAAGEPGPLNAA